MHETFLYNNEICKLFRIVILKFEIYPDFHLNVGLLWAFVSLNSNKMKGVNDVSFDSKWNN